MTDQIRLAFRRLRSTPGFTAAAVASLAVAIGLNVLIFSFTSPVLFKALPYPDPDRLLDVSMAPPGKPEAKGAVTPALYLLLRDKTSAAFDAVGAFDAGWSANLAGDASGPAERLDGHRISATGLAALGAKPLLGRLPVAADEEAGRKIKTCVENFIHELHHRGGFEGREGEQEQETGHELGPNEKREAHPGHARRA
jgi:hypothetical protein